MTQETGSGVAKGKENKNVKKLDEYRTTKPKQLELFQCLEPERKRYSNTIELYDAIPKYVWRSKGKKEGEITTPVKRDFKHKGISYRVSVSPAWIEAKNGTDQAVFPGQREELIEDVLRRFACEGKGMFLDDSASVVFTLYELQQELRRMGHGYDINQIQNS